MNLDGRARDGPGATRGGRGATLHAEEWLLPLAMACDLESESSVLYQSPIALSRCVCDLSQICEIFLCAEPIIFDQNQ